MVLASFTIVAIALIAGFSTDKICDESSSLFYLSIAMFSFIIGSYLFRFTINRWLPYTGETLN